MHFKRIISLLACVFFGYLAYAGQQRDNLPQAIGNVVHSFNPADGMSIGAHEEQSDAFSQQKQDNKDISFRKRFRPGSQFVFSIQMQQEQARSFATTVRACVIPWYNRHMLPAYYAFLFRLTPF